jgi:uncharacterized protein with FMN-binding domain
VKPKKRITNNLVALGAAAVLAVYSAGYARTQSAAARFAGEDAERRPAVSTGAVGPARVGAPEAAGESLSVSTPAAVAAPIARPAPAPASARPKQVAAASATPTRASDSVPVPATPATPVPAPAPVRDSASTTAASQTTDSTAQPPEKDRGEYRDGSYTGWGTSRHGDIQATVETKGGHIVNAYISICNTRYSCSVISALPPQVVVRQSPNVDYVSGATLSTNAFYYAVVEALSKAK